MIQVFVLPAMVVSQIYSKTLYASQDVKTPVKTSMVSLGGAAALYLGLFPFVGYLAIPIGVVISGYLKNFLLARACRKRELVRRDGRTVRAVMSFAIWATVLGVGLSFIPVTGIFTLGVAIVGYGIVYLPVAYVMDRFIK